MKKFGNFITLVTVIILPFAVFAQADKAYDMNINGVKVIVQRGGNEIVVVKTIIKGGVQNYPADKAGIESLTIMALTECGTAKDDKNSFKNKLDKVSAQLSGVTDMDYSTLTLNCIRSDFETVWSLYKDALLTPEFDPKEFERIKQDAITRIRANESDPDFAIDQMAKQTAFGGRNYSKNPQGTVETITPLTSNDLKKYYKALLTRSRIVIVIVGDIQKSIIENKIRELTQPIPAGATFVSKKETYTAPIHSFKTQERENATNYVQGISGAPLPGTPDFNAYILALRIFSNRHFVEVRSKQGLSYAPGVWFSQGTTPYSNIYVTTTEPDKYIAVARQLVDKIKKEGFTAEELKNTKTQYLTGIYYRQETNDAQAASLAFNEVVHGNWRRANLIKDDIKKVTLTQMNNAFRKYFTNITWSYQGDPKKVNSVLYTQKQTPSMPEEKKGF